MFEKEDEKRKDAQGDAMNKDLILKKKKEKYDSVQERRNQQMTQYKNFTDKKEKMYRDRERRLNQFRQDASVKESRLNEL
eukprot:CAMPEP_0176342468 /NCGR_PEP_ID=MMETSP0126-20121128/3186_1 /TAXON_ID=141414 ORGANISM="Strombidinopsis acuminatum, Strain SPMC142" /NCGR_SAMPLE_ID=MMETSP0126 /ASSEMBLY_ACC=CAM_ASM_000229 /LENGTH=79 /DNA_ID=CAMNT_0017687871 /DNA_START=588 /DNA_END=827 /DNA_ORIENTATION=-